MLDEFFQFGATTARGNSIIHIGDCLSFLKEQVDRGVFYDAIVTDPPYEISLHGKEWDSTGIAFSNELWSLFYDALKPGGYVISFAASRFYHRVAIAAETANFRILPMLTWEFPNGLPKPVNVSELFDRDNVKDRKPIGYRSGSGFTTANEKHGAQQRITKQFPVYERGVSQEAKDWDGFYYGNNCLKPVFEPMIFAQKEPSEKRMIDNIRKHGVGALNLGAVKKMRDDDKWIDPIFRHPKATRKEHNSDHPSVKPVSLMKELCTLVCPPGGHVLDPFGGSGSTAVAAIECGFDCTIVEQNPEMEQIIKSRLNK